MRKLVVIMALVALTGCAGEQAGDEGAAPSISPTSPSPTSPTLSAPTPPTAALPSAPPKSPSDPRPGKDVLVGRVTRGGSGPCFGVETDEGKRYAIYTTAKINLRVGETIRVEYEPLRLKINCGEGRHVSAITIGRVG